MLFYLLLMRTFLLIIIIFISTICKSQTLGGNAIFNFLSQPNTAQLSALGGVNVSNISNDVGMVFQNPSLLRKEMHQQLNVSFNSFLAGIKNYSLTSAWHSNKYKTNIAIGINYFNYGSLTQTDVAGNILANFKPNDYVVQLSASKQHKENWFYAATIKFINSNYGQYKSNGIAIDAALAYIDSSNFLQASVVIKNIGTQLKTYSGSNVKEELPFDVQAGITKRLAKAPLQFSLTAHHLHRGNILYNDTTFKATEGDDSYKKKNYTIDKIFSHLIFSAQLFLSNKIEVTTGYNFLRRHDLNVYNQANNLNGFTFGIGVLTKKFHCRYSSGFYQKNMYHQLGLNLSWGNSL